MLNAKPLEPQTAVRATRRSRRRDPMQCELDFVATSGAEPVGHDDPTTERAVEVPTRPVADSTAPGDAGPTILDATKHLARAAEKRAHAAESRSHGGAPTARPTSGDTSALTAEQWFDLGCDLESESREESRRAYHQALALDPTLADAHINLGRQYHETQNWAQAEDHYRAAAGSAHGDPVPWFNLGVLFDDMHRTVDAIGAYREAIARDPRHADAHYNLGLSLDSLGQRPEAMAHLMKARQLYGRGERE